MKPLGVKPLTTEEMAALKDAWCSQPCTICGAVGYEPSMGGPGICPSCDSGTTLPTVLMERIGKLLEENAALRWVLAMVDDAWWSGECGLLSPACSIAVCGSDECVAAIKAAYRERKARA